MPPNFRYVQHNKKLWVANAKGMYLATLLKVLTAIDAPVS